MPAQLGMATASLLSYTSATFPGISLCVHIRSAELFSSQPTFYDQ